MNKKQRILLEAKRLFGRYGYLGFTLKQLALACEMTSPALYYFYSSKADLFHDCLISEFKARREVLEHCMTISPTLEEFSRTLAYEAIEVCDVAAFRAGQAMREVIHLPEEMQVELHSAWNEYLIEPVEAFISQMIPGGHPTIPHRLIAVYLINMATFSATHVSDYSRDQLAALFATVARSLQPVANSLA